MQLDDNEAGANLYNDGQPNNLNPVAAIDMEGID